MPAMLDDPDTPTIYRLSGAPPYPDPDHPALPADMSVRQVTLRDRQTVATIVPFASRHQVPASLLAHLSDQLNKEIEGGDTYPMVEGMSHDKFARYWFQNFGAIMLLGSLDGAEDVVDGKDWAKECLGSFYIKPNYPGRSSHVCNAGFLVTDAARNRGVGRLMGEAYLDWAPRLGYSYSVFNLVYETNVASCKIWDALGFKRIGRVKGCGNLKSHPGRLIDAIIYGRDLAPADSGDEQLVSEERFDKIKFYLKYARYPNGADRAEKSRLRSAATHYKLVGDRLMLKDKEVIADPARQYDIARGVHVAGHAGINKSTATIAERFHWSGIKQTVSDVIRNCAECKELGKAPVPGVSVGDKRRVGAAVAHGTNNSSSEISSLGTTSIGTTSIGTTSIGTTSIGTTSIGTTSIGTTSIGTTSIGTNPMGTAVSPSVMTTSRPLTLPPHHLSHLAADAAPTSAYANPNDISVAPSHHHGLLLHDHHHQMVPSASVYQPIDPQMIDSSTSPHHDVDDDPHNPFGYHDPDETGHDGVTDDVDVDVDDADHTDAEFRELLRAAEADSHHAPRMDGPELDADRVDRDLDMLIEHAVRGDLGGSSVEVDVDHDMGDVAGGEDVNGRDGRHDDNEDNNNNNNNDDDDDDGRNSGDGGTKGGGGGLYDGIVRFDGAVL